MELPEIVQFAQKFSVMDPKGLKMRNHAFHQYHSGKTTLSASGMLLPKNLSNICKLLDCKNHPNDAVVVTVASIVEPFLLQKFKQTHAQGTPELIPGAKIDIMIEVEEGMEQSLAESKWFGAQVLKLVDVPSSSAAIQSLIEASSMSPENGWEVGWSLAAHIDSPHTFTDSVQTQEKGNVTSSTENQRSLIHRKSSNSNLVPNIATRIAFLHVPTLLDKDLPEVMVSPLNKRGDVLLSVGSPFGILSPLHFFNSISVGSVANCYPPMSSNASLLMADIRCLPGMEGGPVFGQHAYLIGILSRPLRQTGGAEIQVVIPWKAVEASCSDLFQSVPQKLEKGLPYTSNFYDARTERNNFNSTVPLNCTLPLPVEQAMNSVCLITLDDGVWASGVLLNDQGLLLTNAHLLEPWRFGKTRQSTPDESRTKNLLNLFENSTSPRDASDSKSEVFWSNSVHPLDYLHHPINQVHRRISVRMDLMNSRVWCDAKVVYVSKGPLDISLLQLKSVPHQLCPISVDFACPSPGSKAFVIGHGLLGPRCELFPSICSGVVAKVVKIKPAVGHIPTSRDNPAGNDIPVMLETTASVHPGGSGGAVVNSSGHMIGLVTSNAKHGGGTIIPHMNFSVPSAALEPVFVFAKDMQNLSLLRQLDRPNKELASIWAMMPPTSPEPRPLLPGTDGLPMKDKEKQEKGSRFAKFINERHELFRKSRDLSTTEDLSRDTIPSKL